MLKSITLVRVLVYFRLIIATVPVAMLVQVPALAPLATAVVLLAVLAYFGRVTSSAAHPSSHLGGVPLYWSGGVLEDSPAPFPTSQISLKCAILKCTTFLRFPKLGYMLDFWN